MTFKLPHLPYSAGALEPHMSKRTLEYHHGKHHAGYVNKLNDLIDNSAYAEMSLQEIVVESARLGDLAVFNNAAQAFNHELFWNSMSPAGNSVPEGELAGAIDQQFGGLDELTKKIRLAANTLFGSGWVWLISDAGNVRIVTTTNAGTPLVDGLDPLLTLDVWEHAYYLDVQNDRAKYVDTFLHELINWAGASDRYATLRNAA